MARQPGDDAMGWPWDRRRRREAARPFGRAAHRRRPVLSPLEDRQLLTVAAVTVEANPDILSPPDGRFVQVDVTGTVTVFVEAPTAATQPRVPETSFQVTDEFRRIEPRGPVTLVKLNDFSFQSQGQNYNASNYTYEFPITLQASRSSRDSDGRQYSLLVGAEDHENGQGTTIPILVPVDRNDIQIARLNQFRRAELLKKIRAMPPVQDSGTNSGTFWERLGFG